ncbi:MAG: hypothetical protein JXC32_04820 [Anaerolineae bacterium]|nr:hypothetical protein [Anaerolineae bacterium]
MADADSAPCGASPERSVALVEALRYLEELGAAVVEDSRVRPGECVAGHGPNTTGGTLIRPGGRDCYPAFWVRDFAMSLESGLVTPDEAVHALLLTARLQAPEDRRLRSGSFVPRGSIADHITFGGKPIFYPGTLDDVDGQGQPFGYYPSLDDHFYFAEMAWHAIVVCGREDLLYAEVDGTSLLERLALAFSVPKVDPASQLVVCDEDDRGVSFGFTDSVIHTGKLLFCSLLRYRAALRMVELYRLAGSPASAARYARIASTISDHLPGPFAHESGLLVASTGASAQPDVWGSAFAVYTGALPERVAADVSGALSRALASGSVAWKGNIRHVPTDADYSATTAWERVVDDRPKNRYQNGAYWGTPVGWVCYAVAQHDSGAAERLASDFVTDLRAGDYRQGPDYGAPWECMHPDGDHRQNPVYMCSVTTPLGAFRRMGWLD